MTSFMTSPSVTTGISLTTPLWLHEEVLWLLIVGFVAAFILSFAVGANDVANSFGTTVGAKVLTLRQACFLATIFETSGAVLLGAKVGKMIRKGIIDVNVYQTEDGAKLLMMGEVAAMLGSGIWQLVATLLKLPVSGTHSIVGACIGFSLVGAGSSGVNWGNLGFIVASWFVSPVLSGIMSVSLYYAVERFIIRTKNPLTNGLKILPLFYAVTIAINVFSVLRSGLPQLGLKNFPIWKTFLIGLSSLLATAIAAKYFIVPKFQKQTNESELDKNKTSNRDENLKKHSLSTLEFSSNEEKKHVSLPTEKEKEATLLQNEKVYGNERENQKLMHFKKSSPSSPSDSSCTDPNESVDFRVKLMSSDTSIDRCDEKNKTKKMLKFQRKLPPLTITEKEKKSESLTILDAEEADDPAIVRRLFSSLQVLTACFASFAHGGNDVSNAIGPLIALWIVFWSGNVAQTAVTPWYLLLYGGVGISIGLWLFGRRVMETIGKDLTKLTPSRGFSIELMTAFTVLLASNMGIPISTTHCKVGAVVSVGWFRSRAAVDWSMARNIAFAWFVTLPVAGLLSAGSMFILMKL